MNHNENDARQRMITAAIEILQEVSDIEKITVRQIAKRANVGVGSINYHFNSRDNLLSVAVENILAKKAISFSNQKENLNMEPVVRLKTMLKELCSETVKSEKLVQFMITQEILSGDMHALLHLIPVLKEIFHSNTEEKEMRVIALQILQPLQVAAIAPSAFHMYSGYDLYDTKERNQFIDMLIDNLVKKGV